MGRIDLRDPPRDEDLYHPEPCTCTVACIPQGKTGEQVCRMSLDGPEYSDCETAAHLRDCGFCRAVILDPRVERMWKTMQTMMDDPFMEGSEPRRVFYALPKRPPQQAEVRRRRSLYARARARLFSI